MSTSENLKFSSGIIAEKAEEEEEEEREVTRLSRFSAKASFFLKQKFQKTKQFFKSTKTVSDKIKKEISTDTSLITLSESTNSLNQCKICLNNFNQNDCLLFELNTCKCIFCINCLNEYIKQSVNNCNVLPINCPDLNCKFKGHLNSEEIKHIILGFYDSNNNLDLDKNLDIFNKYLKQCENLEILRDPSKTHCPKPSCQNVCQINHLNTKNNNQNVKVICEKCKFDFCSICFKKWSLDSGLIEHDLHDICNCTEETKNLLENIKRCPKCAILIERADGCAQLMCKICKHTFCFYCLTSLENDYLLKHYTKNGPCKGKLGHSKLSLFFHRLTVVAIFSGTILVLIALSPFILLSLPFVLLNRKVRNQCLNLSAKLS